jgi:ethanolamine ammonia-lyase small subunit
MNNQDIQSIVTSVIKEINKQSKAPVYAQGNTVGDEVPDLTATGNVLNVANPENKSAYEDMLKSTSARIGVGRAGTRPLTKTWLKFRADHGVAQDAVLSYADQSILDSLGFVQLESKVADKDEYLTRPDLGRILSDESVDKLKKEVPAGAQVQIIVGDGLSAKAIDANIRDILPPVKEGLKAKGYNVGKDIFVKNARVGIVNNIGEILKPEMILLFIGERPGLGTAESMSAYLTYAPKADTVEADRTMMSNIHKGGVPPVEAGAQLVSLVEKILMQKASGYDLEL